MIDSEVINYIRDEMLKDINIDAEIPWAISKLAYNDDFAYTLMNRYMEEVNSTNKKLIMNRIINYIDEKSLIRSTEI